MSGLGTSSSASGPLERSILPRRRARGPIVGDRRRHQHQVGRRRGLGACARSISAAVRDRAPASPPRADRRSSARRPASPRRRDRAPPRRARMPMRPLERLVSTRTGSSGSSVRPAPTSDADPRPCCVRRTIARSTASPIASIAARRPGPSSPEASGPDLRARPRRAARARARAGSICVAALPPHLEIHRGAHDRAARGSRAPPTVSASGASPWTSRAIRSAVAGAITSSVRRLGDVHVLDLAAHLACSPPPGSSKPRRLVAPQVRHHRIAGERLEGERGHELARGRAS